MVILFINELSKIYLFVQTFQTLHTSISNDMLVVEAHSYFPISDIIGINLFCRPKGSSCFSLV